MTALVLVHVVRPILPIPPKLDRTIYEIRGWDLLGERVGEIKKNMPRPDNSFIFGLRYQVASELAFYVPGQPFTVSINRWNRPNVYDYWWQDEDLIGWDAVGVTYASDHHTTRLNQIFERVDPPVKLEITRKPVWRPGSDELIKTFYLYRAYGFKGGLRWEPKDKQDIRVR